MFVCIVSELGHFIRYPSAITWNIPWSPGESLQLASAGALFSLRKKNPLAKSWVTVQCLPTCPPPALGHWSQQAVSLLTALTDAEQKAAWIFSLVHLVVYCITLKLAWRFSKEIGVWKVMTLLIFMSYASGSDLLHSSLGRCSSLSGGWTIPQPWNCSRSGWMRPWESWPSQCPLCPWQGSSK